MALAIFFGVFGVFGIGIAAYQHMLPRLKKEKGDAALAHKVQRESKPLDRIPFGTGQYERSGLVDKSRIRFLPKIVNLTIGIFFILMVPFATTFNAVFFYIALGALVALPAVWTIINREKIKHWFRMRRFERR